MESSIRLNNHYSKTAEDVKKSASELGCAMGKLGSDVKKTDGILFALGRRKTEIKIKDVGSKEAQARIRKLQSEYQKATGKRYRISVMADDGGAVGRIKGLFSGVKKVGLDTSAFLKAKADAVNVNSEIRKLTGKRHKINIEMPESLGKAVGGLKAGLGGLGGIVAKGGMALAGGTAVAGGMAMAGGGYIAHKGMQRLNAIEGSKAKLRGLGHDNKAVEQIMGNALVSVKGTAFSMGDAATTGAGAVAAGIKPGEDLERMLKSVANSAAATGVGMDEMGSIYNKIATSGKAYNDTLGQIADRGLPIYQKLAEELGVTADEVREMASDGKISYEQFEGAMAKASGTVADEMGKTTAGSLANFNAALGRLGATVLKGAFEKFPNIIQTATGLIDKLAVPAEKFGVMLGGMVTNAVEQLPSMLEKSGSFIGEVGGRVKPIIEAVLPPLSTLGQIILETATAVLPLLMDGISTIGGLLLSYLSPVFQFLADAMTGFVIPAFNLVATLVRTFVFPAFSILGNIIKAVVYPIFKVLGSILKAVFKPALDAVTDVLKTAIMPVFKDLAKWVGTAVDKFMGLIDAIGGFISSIAGGIKDFFIGNNATGSVHYGGGWTHINERGQEMMRLPKGTTIYPAGKTDKIMKRHFQSGNNANSGNKQVSININVVGSQSNEDTARAIKRDLEKIIPNI